MIKALKNEALYLFGILVLIFVFYPGLFFAKYGALAGDHWEQHYPWAALLSNALKHGMLPFWTDLIHSGFPIAAEGQIGVFYLPNLVLGLLLPVNWAYSYTSVLHYFLTGSGMYLYCRALNLKPAACLAGVMAYLFGTGYGGAYYNITSLKTLCWYPWMLWAYVQFLRSSKLRYLGGLIFFVSQSILAGYLQVAVYGLIFFALYVFATVLLDRGSMLVGKRPELFRSLLAVSTALFLGILLTAPQLWMTYKLAVQSNRLNPSPEYAYVGSLFPGALSTLFYPMTQGLFRGNSLYVGSLSLMFVCFSYPRNIPPLKGVFWVWFSMTCAAVFFALGEWSPVYRLLIETTRFYSFRTPAKFLIFICFAVSMLSALGFHHLMGLCEIRAAQKIKNRRLRAYLILSGTSLGVLTVFFGACFAMRGPLISFGRWFVENFIHGKTGHPYGLEAYLERLPSFINTAISVLTPLSLWNAWCYAMILFAAVAAWVMLRADRLNKKHLMACLLLLAVDLYGFSFYDIRKDYGNYRDYLKPDPAVEVLKAAHDRGEVGKVYGMRSLQERLPLIPSNNMLIRVPDIGAYSPLVLRRYFEVYGPFGNINDSNFALDPEPGFVAQRLPLLHFLDVTHIFSKRAVELKGFKLLYQDAVGEIFLYESDQKSAGAAYFIHRHTVVPDWQTLKDTFLEPGFDPKQTVLIEQTEAERAQVPSGQLRGDSVPALDAELSPVRLMLKTQQTRLYRVQTTQPGFFVAAETYDAGWSVELDDHEAVIIKAYGMFQGIYIAVPGVHYIRITYNPF